MDGSPKELFKAWHLLFNKEYTLDAEEAKQRFRNFKVRLAEIREHNAKNLPYTLGLNQFSDLTYTEFEAMYLTEKHQGYPTQNFLSDDDDDDLTKRNLQSNLTINWTAFYPPVRDQGKCGSCWAFSVTGSIDGNRGIKNNGPRNYTSPQQLVDCDRSQRGCNGGKYASAFSNLQKTGIMLDSSYPYKAKQGFCQFNRSNSTNTTLVKLNGTKFCDNGKNIKCSEGIVQGLLLNGPLSVSIDASSHFGSYRGGIYNATCGHEHNHAINLVGFGFDNATNLNYWLIRNSWNTRWGEMGYARVAVNESNVHSCWITNRAYLPVIVHDN
jgi:C1A family cysteine protease